MEEREAADSAAALAEVDLAAAPAASAEADTEDTTADSGMDLITVLTIIITDRSSLEDTDPITVTATAAVVALAVYSVCLWRPSLYYLW